MEEALGAEVVAALDAIAPNWRELLSLRRWNERWDLHISSGATQPLLAVIFDSPVVATLDAVTMDATEIGLVSGFQLPAVERVSVYSYRPGAFAGSWVDMGVLRAVAPALQHAWLHAETVVLAPCDQLRSLGVTTSRVPAWHGLAFPALQELNLTITELEASPLDAAWLLDGHLAPSLRRFTVSGNSTELVLRLPSAPMVGALDRLEVHTHISDDTGRRLVEDAGYLEHVKQTSFNVGRDRPWLRALHRPAGRRQVVARSLLRGERLFHAAPHPGVRCWEFKGTGKGAVTVGVVQIRQDLPEGPATLEEALCALTGAWGRYSTASWHDPRREFGTLARFLPGAWENLLDRADDLFRPCPSASFDAALDAAVDAMHAAADVRVTENYARLLPRSFTPPVGPANRACVATDEPNDKLMVAETDDAYVLLVWIS